LFQHVRFVLEHRDRFREGSVLNLACMAYAPMYRRSIDDPAALAPLQRALMDQEGSQDSEFGLEGNNNPVAVRCAAAQALGETGELAVIWDLESVAKMPEEELRLRSSAIQGLAEIARVRLEQKQSVDEIADAFFRLLESNREGSDPILQDIAIEFAKVAPLDGLSRILALLSVPERNFSVQRGIYPFLSRFPNDTERIATDTLAAAAALNDDQIATLYPKPGRMLAEIAESSSTFNELSDDELFKLLRNLAMALAKISAVHPESSVRILAHQNLQQVIARVDLSLSIDPAANSEVRERRWEQWRSDWSRIESQLYLNEIRQLESRHTPLEDR
jgi:hypothetical protein